MHFAKETHPDVTRINNNKLVPKRDLNTAEVERKKTMALNFKATTNTMS